MDSSSIGHVNFITISVDMGGVESQIDIVKAIARELKYQISKRVGLKERAAQVWEFVQKFEAMGVKYRTGEHQSTSDDARDELVENIARLADMRADIDGVFVCIDEADAPPESADLGEFIKLFTERLTRRNCNNVLLGLSGLPSTIGKLRASHESSPRILEVLRLDPLEPGESKQVIEKGLLLAKEKNQRETRITEEAMNYLCELSEGYPHFIQQFAYSAFAADTDYYIDRDDVLSGALAENGALAQLGSKYFNEMYYGRVNSSEYRKVLNTMAGYGDKWVPRKTLVKESGVKETTLNNALNALKAKNVILSNDDQAGQYRLPTKSFAAWINAIKSVAARRNEDEGALFEEIIGSGDPAVH